MESFEGKRVVVLGLGISGLAAARVLLERGASVEAWDEGSSAMLAERATELRQAGAVVELEFGGAKAGFDLAIVSPGMAADHRWLVTLRQAEVPLMGELELGYRLAECLHVAVTGTNGKTTTTELIAAVLGAGQRRTVAAGNIGRPLCAVAGESRELDFITVEASSCQLETVETFRPVVGVLTNLTEDHLERYEGSMELYARAKARLFASQRPHDWAVMQWEALEQFRALGLEPPSKVMTFSARCAQADLYLDRSLLVSRLPDWSGPVLDLEHCRLNGPHNAENLMAAALVGRALKVPLEAMTGALRDYEAQPHRCEFVAEIEGVRFYNDSKATNLDAMRHALLAMPGSGGRRPPNIWLIAGGRDKGGQFHDAGPLLSRRVKGAVLLGEARKVLRAAWALFTPCHLACSMVEAVQLARRNAVSGDVVLLSPACASFDMFADYEQRGEQFRQAVRTMATGHSPAVDNAIHTG